MTKSGAAAPRVRLAIHRGTHAWKHFWFYSGGQAQLRLFRIGFGLLLFLLYGLRSIDLELFFLDSGVMPRGPASFPPEMAFRLSLFEYLNGRVALWTLNGYFLACLLLLAFGIVPRLAAVAALVLHVSFLHRNMAVSYGVDLIATFYLFYLCLADFRDDDARQEGDLQSMLGSMAFRLAQIQGCLIYGYSGMAKLKGASWWRGEAIWDVLANAQFARWDFSWMTRAPLLIMAATYLTLLWEVYFPVLVWVPRWRRIVLGIGTMIHAGIGIAVNLPFFSALMILLYVLFLDQETTASIGARLETAIMRRTKSPVLDTATRGT